MACDPSELTEGDMPSDMYTENLFGGFKKTNPYLSHGTYLFFGLTFSLSSPQTESPILI